MAGAVLPIRDDGFRGQQAASSLWQLSAFWCLTCLRPPYVCGCRWHRPARQPSTGTFWLFVCGGERSESKRADQGVAVHFLTPHPLLRGARFPPDFLPGGWTLLSIRNHPLPNFFFPVAELIEKQILSLLVVIFPAPPPLLLLFAGFQMFRSVI